MKGRATVAFTWSTERPLFERSEDMALSDRDRGEGFQFSFSDSTSVTAGDRDASVRSLDNDATLVRTVRAVIQSG
jgi:hypothetical protein